MTVSEADSEVFAPAAIAPQFVKARQEGVSVPGYPGGVIPSSMAEGYAVQDASPDGQPNKFRAIAGGFCAVEAEFIVRLGQDAPADKTEWTAEEAADYVGELLVGVEIAGSPLATINALGPTVVASDFGNNDGQIIGQAISNWRDIAWEDMPVETFLNGKSLGKATAATIPGSPLAALAFLLGTVAARGKPLKKGMIVTTGATTGIHDVVAGDVAHVSFGPYGTVDCIAVPAK